MRSTVQLKCFARRICSSSLAVPQLALHRVWAVIQLIKDTVLAVGIVGHSPSVTRRYVVNVSLASGLPALDQPPQRDLIGTHHVVAHRHAPRLQYARVQNYGP